MILTGQHFITTPKKVFTQYEHSGLFGGVGCTPEYKCFCFVNILYRNGLLVYYLPQHLMTYKNPNPNTGEHPAFAAWWPERDFKQCH